MDNIWEKLPSMTIIINSFGAYFQQVLESDAGDDMRSLLVLCLLIVCEETGEK